MMTNDIGKENTAIIVNKVRIQIILVYCSSIYICSKLDEWMKQ